MRKMIRILMAAGVLALAGALCGCSFMGVTSYIYDNSDKYTAGDREIKDKIEKIDIDYLSGQVTLTGNTGESIKITETAKKELDDQRKVHTWVDGTTLYIRFCDSGRNMDLNHLDKKLTVTIPADTNLSDLKIQITSGDVKCSDIAAENVDVDTSSGDVDVSCTAANIKVDASSGDITLTATAEEISVESSSGDIVVKQTGKSRKIAAEASSGALDITAEEVINLRTKTSSGRIKVTADTVGNFESDSSSGRCEASFAQAPDSTDIETSSGSVKLLLPANAELTAEFDTSSGDITYEFPFTKDGNHYVSGAGTSKLRVETSSGDITIGKRD